MKKFLLCTTLLALCPSLFFAQAPDTVWTKTYGGSGHDIGYSVLQTTDGGYIIAGETSSFGAGGTDVYLIRTDADGDTLWTKTYGGSNDDGCYSMQPTADGNYIIAGYTASYGSGGRDIWILEINSLGDTLRTGIFGGTDDDVAISVTQSFDSAYVTTGKITIRTWGSAFLLKTSLNGSYDWMKTYSQEPILSAGNSVIQTSDGGYIIAATCSNGWFTFWIWLIKTDTIGDPLWIKWYYPGCFLTGDPHILQITDGYIVAGAGGCAAGGHGIFLLKTDVNGDSLWAKNIYPSDYTTCKSLQQTSDGGYIIAGLEAAAILLIKTNAIGDTLWTKLMGGSDIDLGFSVQQTSDNGYIVVGFTYSYGAGARDVYLIKIEPDVGLEEEQVLTRTKNDKILHTTIFSGSLQLPKDKKCKIYDITGRVVEPDKITHGIYFIEVDGVVTQKVVKIR